MTWPDGWYVTYDYDALNRLTHVRENGTTLLAQYGFDALSRRVSVSFLNGTSTTYDFDPGDNDLNRIDHAFSGSSAAFDYTYNQVNERTSLTVSDDLYLLSRWQNSPAASNTNSDPDSADARRQEVIRFSSVARSPFSPKCCQGSSQVGAAGGVCKCEIDEGPTDDQGG